MKLIKKMLAKYKKLPTFQKVQAIMASLLTLFLAIAIPTFAWFSISSKIETLTKIKAPLTLDIKAGHAYSIEYLDLSDIDVTDVDSNGVGYKDYVFAVKAGNSSAYDIQLAHTTNIPFTYTLFRATEIGDSEKFDTVPNGTVTTFEYTDVDDTDENSSHTITYYYGYASGEKQLGSESIAKLDLVYLNLDSTSIAKYGRRLAERTGEIYTNITQYSLDEPEIYAVPLYSQHTNIATWNADGDYFILRISWDTNNDNTNFAAWNAAINNKETDMIYISAKASVSQN